MTLVGWSRFVTVLGYALAAALVTMLLVHLAVRLTARRWQPGSALVAQARVPFRVFLVAIALAAVVGSVRPDDVGDGGWEAVRLASRLLTIGTGAWLLASALLYVEDLGLRRYRTDVPDNRVARRVRTQVLILRRLTVTAVVVVAVGATLLSFPGVRAVGASVLASAGLIGVVAALAAQSTLANMFAGMQLAFSDAIRIDDVVVVETEWGRVEEITLSYVVVRLWDDRRLVLPSTYFVSTPFQNWTRRSAELLGTVEMDLDWRVDVAAMRVELDRLLRGTELWDARSGVLQVVDAVGGVVRVRALVSAADAGSLFDLRCLVREHLVRWVQDRSSAPRQRVELTQDQG